jgi:large subunit ribosomal protein L25
LPADIPTEFRADVSNLALNGALRASDLPLDKEKIKLLTEPDRVLAHVVALRVEEEKPADVAAAATTPAEPEVIKKGKKEEEGEAGAEAGGKAEKGAEKDDKKKK